MISFMVYLLPASSLNGKLCLLLCGRWMMSIEIRICNDCGEEWPDTGDEQCPFCGSWDTDIKDEDDEENTGED